MIKSVIIQQREERDFLLGLRYVKRITDVAINDYLSTSLIKLITGPRRAGKSVLALQLLADQNFAYLNFDDDLLLRHFDEDALIQALHEIYGDYKYLMLDEIQNLPGWELWINKLFRRGANMVITGSNAKLLSHELASSLTGRYIQITIFPFSFNEIIRFQQSENFTQPQQSPAGMGNLSNLLNTYLVHGGYPETVLNPAILKNYLYSLFDSILLKDILKRFKIRQTQQLYDLSNYLLANYTNPYSANQLKTDLDFRSVATVQKFIGYMEATFLFFSLTRYAVKIKNQQRSPKKIYIIDNGFVKARSFELSPNYGRLLENLVFIELVRRNYQPGLGLFYYRTRNGREVDFLLRSGHTAEQLVQVCYDPGGVKVLKRETDALTEAALELNCFKLKIINWDREEIIKKNEFQIQLIPVQKWLRETLE